MRVLLQVAAAVLVSSVVLAQDALPQRMLEAAPINLQFQNALLPDVIGFVARAVGLTIRIAPEVDVSRPVNIKFTNAKPGGRDDPPYHAEEIGVRGSGWRE